MPNFLSSRRTSPVVFGGMRDNRTHYPVDVTGGDRNSPINRRMSANRFLGMGPQQSGTRHSARDSRPSRQSCQRPDRLRRGERAWEVAEIVGESMKLKADGVGGERAARDPP